ncbi:Uncharacterised protein [Sebaldella termitidis]|jgi:hypothetical protein|uniref:Porin n=1 Tax=Sebaldella termitidis (strain ATCC 33386 / NCTC 11300) TaxID=526218 RepID=D1AP44_SEBTE|nr:hypothetical protein [Sebaldella termitidis]ACZ07518.1 hypothetical protein Sterm_0646 [Sebaldella termitidis ATCC 33386]SUI22814.1 Uncharacterised protein [Sebaldella termitidis]
MKKLFGLLALMTVISGVSVADDFTNLSIDSHWRSLHSGRTTNEAMRNRTHMTGQEMRNEFTGKLTLDDEWQGLSFNFDFLKKDFYNSKGKHQGNGWDNDVYFSKDFSKGPFVGDMKLGWKYEGYTDSGHGNEFYFGPTVGFKLLGQEGTFSAQFVYYNDVNSQKDFGPSIVEEKVYNRHYKDTGTEGIGGNFDFNFNGTILEGRFGTVSYNLDLKNHLRDATNTKTTTSDGRNTVYLDYDGVISYDSPRFYGFGVGLDIENEYEMQTGNGWYNNGFYLSPKASFKHTFDTSLGKIGVMPYVKWDAIDQQRGEFAESDDTYSGYGDTKLRAGLNISLDRN